MNIKNVLKVRNNYIIFIVVLFHTITLMVKYLIMVPVR